MAKQFAQKAEDATSLFQYALKTRAGCECVAHMVQASTEFNESGTIVSVDGVGAYDLVSRTAMLSGLMDMEEGDRLLPFVRLFYSDPSTFLWDDEVGDTHEIRQGGRRTRRCVDASPLQPRTALGRKESVCLHFWTVIWTRQSASSPPNHGGGVVGPRQNFIAQW